MKKWPATTGPRELWARPVRLPGESVDRQVVGVARTADYTAVGEPPQACVYVPLEQHYSDTMVLYVRTKGSPARSSRAGGA